MNTVAHDLLEGLGLVLEKGHATRYPATQAGPADGYRFWATHVHGALQFGAQVKGQATFDERAQIYLEHFGFRPRDNGREVVTHLPEALESALPLAHIAIAALKAALNL